MKACGRGIVVCLILFSYCIIIAFLFFSGRLQTYIHPRFNALMLLSFAFLFLLGLGGLSGGFQPANASLSILVLIVPLAAAIPYSPTVLQEVLSGTRGVNSGGRHFISVLPDSGGDFSPGSDGLIEVGDKDYLVFMGQLHNNPGRFRDSKVKLAGYVNKGGSGGYSVGRLYLWCCLADAYILGMDVETGDTAGIEAGEWHRISGTIKTGVDGRPYVIADEVLRMREPGHTLLYR